MKKNKLTLEDLEGKKSIDLFGKTWKGLGNISCSGDVEYKWRNFKVVIGTSGPEINIQLIHTQRRDKKPYTWVVQEGYGKTVLQAIKDIESSLFQIASIVGYGR